MEMVARGPGYGKKVAAYDIGIRYGEHERTILDKNRALGETLTGPRPVCGRRICARIIKLLVEDGRPVVELGSLPIIGR